MIFKRKIYKKLLEWKNECNGEKALLIEGARRIGKSTICEEFAKNESIIHQLPVNHPRLESLKQRQALLKEVL